MRFHIRVGPEGSVQGWQRNCDGVSRQQAVFHLELVLFSAEAEKEAP